MTQLARDYLASRERPAAERNAAVHRSHLMSSNRGFEAFQRALFRSAGDGWWIPEGRAYVYAVQPTEKAQTVSSVASAAQSIQLAMAASGMFPGQGIGANAGFGYAQSATGKVQALERVPAIVGFADRTGGPTTHPLNRTATFGWVIGPKVRLDAKNQALVLEQPLANHAVSADIVLPGWWPSVDFAPQSAWVGHWHSKDGHPPLIEDRVPTLPFRQPKPVNRADYDGLTSVIAQRISGRPLQIARIHLVEPQTVSLCNLGVQ